MHIRLDIILCGIVLHQDASLYILQKEHTECVELHLYPVSDLWLIK